MKDFAGKTAFITGGASGIGLGIATTLLEAGAKVVIADIEQAHLSEAKTMLASHEGAAHFIRLDVRDRGAMRRAAEETAQIFGNVHILCNNAGTGLSVPIEEASYEDWDLIFSINLGGTINGIVTFLPGMKAHGEGGHLVNTSSMAGIIPCPSWAGLYSATKFAIRGLSESLRLSLAPFNIGVSTLCPGMVDTRIMTAERRLRPERRGSGADDWPEKMEFAMKPREVGARVLEGIRRQSAFIFTHGHFREEVAALFAEILDDFPPPSEPCAEEKAVEDARRRDIEVRKALIVAQVARV
ncbi:MAG: SDR family oxidoreductase [Alphaproteobacteria bacterium]|nr:SDR family oxidoreductase [Alphaproteobacteria bacterium]MDE2071870.1 SDR family oxidoreductase [Alphaproteobacteria bacterium]MDE2351599.1 SDR family oxidoreductase [Alphaproteobacteria bacterium]